MARAVTCRSSGGVVTSEEQCDQSLRPLAIYPCGDRDCAPHWVEQEWQQVKSKTAQLSHHVGPAEAAEVIGQTWKPGGGGAPPPPDAPPSDHGGASDSH